MLEENSIVKGEVIQPVDESLLKSLDRLESYVEGRIGNLYERCIRTVLTEDGEKLDCWVYIYSDERYVRERGILVPDGDWKKFMENRRGLI